MKKFFMLAGLFLFVATAQANKNQDSVVVYNPQKVTFLTNEKQVFVEIEGSSEDPDYRYKHVAELNENSVSETSERMSGWNFNVPFAKKHKSKRPHTEFNLGGAALGWTAALDGPNGMDLSMGSSVEIAWDHLLSFSYYPWNNGTFFELAAGVAWRNFRMKGMNRFVKEDSKILIGAYPEGSDIQFSRLKIFSWVLPLMIGYDFPSDISLRVGPVLYFNTYGSLKTKYKDADGNQVKLFDKNIHQNKVTVHLQADLKVKSIGVYVKYSPCKVLNSDFGPQFSTISSGLTLFY